MRATRPLVFGVLLGSGLFALACGSEKDSNYSPNVLGQGGGSAAASGTGGKDGGGGVGGFGGGTGTGGGNFGGGGPGCDGAKRPSEDACVIHEDYGIFVSPAGADIGADGTRAKPYASFELAMKEAQLAGKRVYACATVGPFDGAINVEAPHDGAALFGGFDCTTWNHAPALKTKLTGPSTGVLEVSDLVKGLTLEDFDITAKDATGSGSPSLGVVVSNSTNVTLRRVKITAGNGTLGLLGATTPGVAKGGTSGNPGKAECQATPSGGGAVYSNCGAPDTVGGKGGDGATGTGSGGDGSPGQLSYNGGTAGKGATMSQGLPVACTNGGLGKKGADGADGAGGTTPGKLAIGGWVPASGMFGGDGQDGGGGGGGGGALAPADCGTSGPNPPTGASGGSGGSGGCGGIGGEGGQGGGASIALISYQSTVTLVDSELVAKNGGKGGSGGKGQLAGSGASGGAGGGGACSGATGGAGGKGGNGGGGAGGPSIGVAYAGQKPARSGGSITVATTAALGGASGSGATTGPGAGAPGVLAPEQAF